VLIFFLSKYRYLREYLRTKSHLRKYSWSSVIVIMHVKKCYLSSNLYSFFFLCPSF